MGSNIITVFLSMALVAGLGSFKESPKTTLHWLAFIYFVMNRVRYYFGDSPWDKLKSKCIRDGLRFERSIGLLFMVTNLFFGIVIGFHIKELSYYFWFSMINLIIGTFYLIYERVVLIDRAKDTGPIKLLDIQKHWIIFNVSEMFLFLVAAITYQFHQNITALIPTLVGFQDNILYFVFFGLYFSMLLDWILHHEFLYVKQ